MKKVEFASALAEKCNLSKKQAVEIVDEFWALILDTMKKGDEVVFNYGKFVVNKRAAREGRNPLTGAKVQIAAKVEPKFKPNKAFKEKIAS